MARARKNFNIVNRAAVEASSKISFSSNIKGAKRERADAEERSKAGTDIR